MEWLGDLIVFLLAIGLAFMGWFLTLGKKKSIVETPTVETDENFLEPEPVPEVSVEEPTPEPVLEPAPPVEDTPVEEPPVVEDAPEEKTAVEPEPVVEKPKKAPAKKKATKKKVDPEPEVVDAEDVLNDSLNESWGDDGITVYEDDDK